MAKTDFRYSDQSFFASVIPDYGRMLGRNHLKSFTQVGSSQKWLMAGIGQHVGAVYFNNIKGTKVANSTAVNSAYYWYYDETLDILYIYTGASGDDPNQDIVVESGVDNATYINQQLTDASMMLNSMIVSVVTPIPKSMIYNNADDETAEYDYVIKKAECLLAYSNMCNGEGEFELADRYYEQVTNIDKTGIVDLINSGDIQLSPFRESVDSRGKIIKGSVSGTMEISLSGTYSGSKYERYKIEVTTTGGYGVGKYVVHSSNSTQLYGNTSSEYIISGQYQNLGGGLEVRFEGGSATDGDIFFVECRNDSPTNSKAGTIKVWR